MRPNATSVRSTTRTLGAALALVLASAACRTTSAAARPATAEAPRCAAPQVTYVALAPTVFVTSDLAFVVLYASMAGSAQGSASFQIAYIASMNGGDALLEDAPRRAAALAAALLDAWEPLLPPSVREADVTAVFGAPGTFGLALPAHVSRGAGGWGAAQTGEVARAAVPPLASPIARPSEGERAAVAAARQFLERADAHDGDGVWDLASAAVRTIVSRQTFEEVLWPASWHGTKGPRRELFRQYDLHTGDFRIGDIVNVSFASEGSVETVRMRLDDDQEWRVADLARGGALDPTAPGTDAPPLPAPTSLTHAEQSTGSRRDR